MTGQHVPSELTVRVWDPLVRIGHWVLVIAVALAWLTRHGGGAWHEYLGYLSLGVVAMRVLWGCRGSRHARFADFLQRPGRTFEYAQQMLRGQFGGSRNSTERATRCNSRMSRRKLCAING